MKVLEVIDFARDLLNEGLSAGRTASFPDDSSSFWKDTTLLRYLNREQEKIANVIINADENFFLTATSINLVANQEEYELPADLIKIKRLELIAAGSDPIEIFPMIFNDKDKLRSNYLLNNKLTGTPSEYAFRGTAIILRPTPGATQPSGIKVYYVPKIADMISQCQVPTIPTQFHELLSLGIARRAIFQQEGDPTHITREYHELMRDLKFFVEGRSVQQSRVVKRKKNRF